jgi:uncharacterized iron-regulated protein
MWLSHSVLMISSASLWRSLLNFARNLNRLGLFALISACSSFSLAQIYDGRTLAQVTKADVLAQIRPGTTVVLGEQHDSVPHHEVQASLLEELSALGLRLNVGMEFFEYTQQPLVDNYLSGALHEADFLRAIGWAGLPFDLYRRQVLVPLATGGKTFGLNIPRALTRKVSQGGLEALTDAEKQLLPPKFTMGNQAYRERFHEVMKDHVPPQVIERYFISQSLWDDTMAWQATGVLASDSNAVLAIIVGEFHAAWFGGLPDRLRERGAGNVIVISQSNDIADVQVHPVYGPRADFIWVTP